MRISELKARQTLKNLATGEVYKVRKTNGGKHLHLVCAITRKPKMVLTYHLDQIGKNETDKDYNLKGFEYA